MKGSESENPSPGVDGFFQRLADGLNEVECWDPFEDRTDERWRGKEGVGSLRFSQPTGKIRVAEFVWLGENDIDCIAQSRRGHLWAALLHAGNCDLRPLPPASLQRLEPGRCVLFRAGKVRFRVARGSEARGIVFRFDQAADPGLRIVPEPGENDVTVEAPPLAPGPDLGYLGRRLSQTHSSTPSERLASSALHLQWIAAFFRWSEAVERNERIDPAVLEKMKMVAQHLRNHPGGPHSIPELARRFGVNEFSLKRNFKAALGTTVFGYLRQVKMEVAIDRLGDPTQSVLSVATDLGFANPSHFSRMFRDYHGFLPREMKRRHQKSATYSRVC